MVKNDKKIVVPGEIVSEERKRPGSHVYVENGKIISTRMGIYSDSGDTASVVPLKGRYVPQQNDLILGIISDEKYSGYTVDINSIYESYVSKDEIRDRVGRGTVISAKVSKVNEINEADLESVRVFYGGEVMNVNPVQVPRLIGKNGSMLQVLKDGTGANILVGRNGRAWVKGGNIQLLKKAVCKIQDEAHLSNLTNSVKEFLEKEGKKGKGD